jgi:hypothetical protein
MEFPITIENQEQFDELISTRLQRARKSFEEENGLDELEARVIEAQQELAQLKEAREEEIASIRSEHQKRELDREVTSLLDSYGVDRKRHKSIRTLLDLEGVEPSGTVARPGVLEGKSRELASRVSKLYSQTPELFGEGARVASPNAPDTGPGTRKGSLTREQLEAMSPEEIMADMERVDAYLASQGSEGGYSQAS